VIVTGPTASAQVISKGEPSFMPLKSEFVNSGRAVTEAARLARTTDRENFILSDYKL